MLFLSLFFLSCVAATDYNQLLQSPSALLNAYKEFRVENPSHGESALRLKLFRNTVKLIAEENSKHQGYERNGQEHLIDYVDQNTSINQNWNLNYNAKSTQV